MKKYFILLALMVIGSNLLAEREAKLEETVITTENFETSVQETPKNITIVTSEEISNKGANSVAEALKGVPGVTISTIDGGEPSIDLRGYGATASQNLIVLIDGIPMNNIQGSDYYTSLIPIELIEKMEVIPSGGAVMYGDGATGGVINIITKSPQARKNYGSLGMEVGSWGTLKENFNYGTKVSEKFLVDIAYNNYKSEGYRDKNPYDNIGDNTNPQYVPTKYDKDDKKESIWLRGKYLLDNGSLEVNYRHNEIEDYYTSGLTKEQFEKEPQMYGSSNGSYEGIEDRYSLKYSKKINEKLDFMTYGGYEELDYDGSGVNYLASQYYIKSQFKYNYGDNSYIIFGGDYKDGKSEDKKNKFVEDKTRKSYAGYILNKTTMDKWQFTQGVRFENIDIKSPDIEVDKNKKVDSYELAINYFYSDTGNIYLSYVNGYRSPSIQDLALWEGNIDVQENETYELGIKDTIGNTYISSSIFYMLTEKEIIFDKSLGNENDKYAGKNTNYDGEIERKGIALSLQHYFDKLILRENISYINAEVESGTYGGKKFAGVPEWTINVGATYNFTDKLIGNIDSYYQSSAYGSSDYENNYGRNNEYITVDMNLKYSFDNGLEIYGGIKNLFDEKYCSTFISYGAYYPADGRSYYAGFRYSF